MPLQLVIVSPEVAEIVLATALAPRLAKLEAEGLGPFRVRPHQWTQTETVELPEILTGQSVAAPVDALARLSFRPNHGGDLYVFRAEVLFRPDAFPSTGFTGFVVDGSVRHTLSPSSVKCRGYVLHYNHKGFSVLG